MQSSSRAPCRASVELYGGLLQSLGKLRKEPLAELCAELSSRAFSRALCRALVEVYAESWQSSVQSFEGASSLVEPLAEFRTELLVKLSLASGDANARAAGLCISFPKTDIAAPTRTNSTPLSPPLDLTMNTEFEVGFA